MTKEIWKNIGYGTIITLVIGAAYFIVITYNDVNKLFNYNLPLLNAEHDEFRNSISSLKAEFESKFDNERTKEDEFMLINKAYEDIELSKRNFDRIEIKINDQIIPSLNFLLESNKNTLFLIQKLNLIGDLSDSIRRLNFFIDSLVAELNKSMKSKNDTNEQYPKNMLKEISDIIPAQELAVQETYNDLIAEADAFFSKEQYEQAKLKYKDALNYKPEEQYPVQKIAEIERLITDFETLKANYLKLIADADEFFKAKEYSEAKPKYVEASALMPDEEYPIMKIEEINKIFKAEMLKIQQAYDKAIADADKFFSAKVYDQALDSYRIAKGTKPNETYPDQMINKIIKILDKNAVRNLISSPVNLENNKEKKFSFEPVLITDRKNSFIFIKAKNISNTEFKIVMSYGKDSSKKGGYILPIPAGDEVKEYIIPIGKQYSWFFADNNWVSLLPLGGSVEISLIKISREE